MAAAHSPPGGERQALLRLALPIMLIAIVNMGMSITDTVMVSAAFGADALAAVAVGSDLQSLFFYLAAGILAGMAPFYTAALVRGDGPQRRRLDRIGRGLVLALAAVGVPLIWSAPDWLRHAGLDPVLLESGRSYTQCMALLLPPLLGISLYRIVLTAAERPQVFLCITLAMLPLNAAANTVLMNGLGPVPALGPTGAGVSSVLVAWASLAALVLVARRALPAAGGGEDVLPADRVSLAAVLRVGVPIGITMIAETGIFLGATLYAATLGAADVAAHTLTLRLAGLAYAGSGALLQATAVRTARALAVHDVPASRGVVSASLALGLAGGAVVLVVLTVGARPLAAAFFGGGPADAAAVELAAGLLLLLGLIQVAGYPGLAASGLLRGHKDSRTPMLCMLAGFWGVGAPVGLYLCERQGMGVTGLWIGLAVGTGITSGLTLLRVPTARAGTANARMGSPQPQRYGGG